MATDGYGVPPILNPAADVMMEPMDIFVHGHEHEHEHEQFLGLDVLFWEPFPPLSSLEQPYAAHHGEEGLLGHGLGFQHGSFPSTFIEELIPSAQSLHQQQDQVLTTSVTEPLDKTTTPASQPTPESTKKRTTRKRKVENGYECQECRTKFDYAGVLAKHRIRKHTPEPDWPFACDLCGKRFYDKRDHTRHMDVERRRISLMSTIPRSITDPVAVLEPPSPAPAPIPALHALPHPQTVTAKSNLLPPAAMQNISVLATSSASSSSSAVIPVPSAQTILSWPTTHATLAAARLAAAADLEKFASLPAARLIVKAIVPMGLESVTFTATHEVVNLIPACHGPSPAAGLEPKPAQRIEAPVVPKPDGELASTTSMTRSQSLHAKPARTLTLAVRARPAFTRSTTLPGDIRKLLPQSPCRMEGGGNQWLESRFSSPRFVF